MNIFCYPLYHYREDYFTDVITIRAEKYFTSQKSANPDDPVFMIVSYSAPHTPDDAAPQHREIFTGTRAPRLPNYNYTSLDKQWIVRTTPPLNHVTGRFTDILYRKRLQVRGNFNAIGQKRNEKKI